MQDTFSFGRWVKRSRLAMGLTQDVLAERVGCATQSIRKIEGGQRRPSHQMVLRLAQVLELSPDERTAFMQAAREPDENPPRSTPAEVQRPAARVLNLPTYLTPFIGRQQEQADLARLLGTPNCRLITLLGPGGIGKTRLAVEVAGQCDELSDGVVFVPLAPISEPEAIVPAIAAALAFTFSGATDLASQLLTYLRDKQLLLVLDNMEHLLGAGGITVELLGQILAQAPRVKLLTTSRERLKLQPEWVVEIEGLPVPPADRPYVLADYPAFTLFLEHAQRVQHGFHLSADDAQAVAEICRLVGGMPLGLELAAAWVRVLSPQEIGQEIAHGLDASLVSPRDLPERHHSLQAVFDQSWHLLSEAERRVLRKLAVFRGGCSREAAAEVAGASLAVLATLVDKSLARRMAAGGVTRYTLHELVLQYAAERLAEDPDDHQATEARHAAYYADLLQRSLGAQTGEPSPTAWAILTRDIDNLRAAWTRAATTGAAETMLAMAPGLMTFYDYRGWLLDGATLFGRAADTLQAAGQAFDAARGLCLGVQGYFLHRMGRLADGVPLLQQGVAITQAAGRSDLSAKLLIYLGTVELFCARFLSSQQQFAQSAQLAEQAGDHATRLWALYFQGAIAIYTGDTAAAEGYLTICIDSWRSQGYGRGIASSLLSLGEIARLRGDLTAAEQRVREALQITSRMHDEPAFARCLRELGIVALAQGKLDEARYLLIESRESLGRLGDQWAYGRSQYALIRLNIQCGDYGVAWQGCAGLLRSALSGDVLRLVDVAYCIALLLVAEGSEQDALTVLIALDGTPGEYATLRPAAHLRADLEDRLVPAQRAAAVEQARGKQFLPWLEELCAPTRAHSARNVRIHSVAP
jgi:predicted ATPase/DNA-binding XRE family transcriptional regulator